MIKLCLYTDKSGTAAPFTGMYTHIDKSNTMILEVEKENNTRPPHPPPVYARTCTDSSWSTAGAKDRACDAGSFASSAMAKRLNTTLYIYIPSPCLLTGRVNNIPCVVVGEYAFVLKPHIMVSYPGREIGHFERIHKYYRLCRARRVSDNAFGIIAKGFHVIEKKNRQANAGHSLTQKTHRS